jgi:hypothetical protein
MPPLRACRPAGNTLESLLCRRGALAVRRAATLRASAKGPAWGFWPASTKRDTARTSGRWSLRRPPSSSTPNRCPTPTSGPPSRRTSQNIRRASPPASSSAIPRWPTHRAAAWQRSNGPCWGSSPQRAGGRATSQNFSTPLPCGRTPAATLPAPPGKRPRPSPCPWTPRPTRSTPQQITSRRAWPASAADPPA